MRVSILSINAYTLSTCVFSTLSPKCPYVHFYSKVLYRVYGEKRAYGRELLKRDALCERFARSGGLTSPSALARTAGGER